MGFLNFCPITKTFCVEIAITYQSDIIIVQSKTNIVQDFQLRHVYTYRSWQAYELFCQILRKSIEKITQSEPFPF